MKGNEKQVTVLLTDELTAVNRYMAHSEMYGSWGGDKLPQAIGQEETRYAEQIRPIIFLEGAPPVVSHLNPIQIGRNVSEMINRDEDDSQFCFLLF